MKLAIFLLVTWTVLHFTLAKPPEPVYSYRECEYMLLHEEVTK